MAVALAPHERVVIEEQGVPQVDDPQRLAGPPGHEMLAGLDPGGRDPGRGDGPVGGTGGVADGPGLVVGQRLAGGVSDDHGPGRMDHPPGARVEVDLGHRLPPIRQGPDRPFAASSTPKTTSTLR